MTDHNREELVEGLRVAMLGTTDGDFIDPGSDIPAGEMFRLAAEYVEAVFEQAHTPTDDERALIEELRECARISAHGSHAGNSPLLRGADLVTRAADALARRTVQGKAGEHGGTLPLYGMLDVWMALYGTSHPEFDEFYAEHGYAETWARLLAAVRERRTVQGEPTDAQEFEFPFALGNVTLEQEDGGMWVVITETPRNRTYWIEPGVLAALRATIRVDHQTGEVVMDGMIGPKTELAIKIGQATQLGNARENLIQLVWEQFDRRMAAEKKLAELEGGN